MPEQHPPADRMPTTCTIRISPISILTLACYALCLLLIGLRLSGSIQDWSWAEILSPLWVPLAFAAVLGILSALVALGQQKPY